MSVDRDALADLARRMEEVSADATLRTLAAWMRDFAAEVRALATRPAFDAVPADHPDTIRLRNLTSRLGFGDGVTEPQADNDTIVGWVEERERLAAEWDEHERYRIDCSLAGHPDDEDCAIHDPHHRLHLLDQLADRVQAKRDHYARLLAVAIDPDVREWLPAFIATLDALLAGEGS